MGGDPGGGGDEGDMSPPIFEKLPIDFDFLHSKFFENEAMSPQYGHQITAAVATSLPIAWPMNIAIVELGGMFQDIYVTFRLTFQLNFTESTPTSSGLYRIAKKSSANVFHIKTKEGGDIRQKC